MGQTSKFSLENLKTVVEQLNETGFNYTIKDHKTSWSEHKEITIKCNTIPDLKFLDDRNFLQISLYHNYAYIYWLVPDSKECSDKNRLFNMLVNDSGVERLLHYGGNTPTKFTKRILNNRINDIVKLKNIYEALKNNTVDSVTAYKDERERINQAEKRQKEFSIKIKDNIERQLTFLKDFEE